MGRETSFNVYVALPAYKIKTRTFQHGWLQSSPQGESLRSSQSLKLAIGLPEGLVWSIGWGFDGFGF